MLGQSFEISFTSHIKHRKKIQCLVFIVFVELLPLGCKSKKLANIFKIFKLHVFSSVGYHSQKISLGIYYLLTQIQTIR